jgi:chloramphenicol 3-O phosphotransferase
VKRVAPVIVLNGGSSSGKTAIACLQRLLGPTWMTLGVDDLVRAQQDGHGPVGAQGSIEFDPDGSVTVGDDFRRAEASWYAGLAAIGRCRTGLILDEVGLVHAMRADSKLAASLRSLFDQAAAAEQIIGRAIQRGELPASAAGRLAPGS